MKHRAEDDHLGYVVIREIPTGAVLKQKRPNKLWMWCLVATSCLMKASFLDQGTLSIGRRERKYHSLDGALLTQADLVLPGQRGCCEKADRQASRQAGKQASRAERAERAALAAGWPTVRATKIDSTRQADNKLQKLRKSRQRLT